MGSPEWPSHEAVTHRGQVLLCAVAVRPSHDAHGGPEASSYPRKAREALSYICQEGEVGSLTFWVYLDALRPQRQKTESLKELLISWALRVEPPEPWVEITTGHYEEEAAGVKLF